MKKIKDSTIYIIFAGVGIGMYYLFRWIFDYINVQITIVLSVFLGISTLALVYLYLNYVRAKDKIDKVCDEKPMLSICDGLKKNDTKN